MKTFWLNVHVQIWHASKPKCIEEQTFAKNTVALRGENIQHNNTQNKQHYSEPPIFCDAEFLHGSCHYSKIFKTDCEKVKLIVNAKTDFSFVFQLTC